MKNLVYLLFLFIFPGSSFTCYQSAHAVLTKPTANALSLEVKTVQPHTATSNDGTLIVSIKGGTAPYTLQVISTVSPAQVFNTDKIELKKQGVGNYTLIVQDASKQIVQKTIELTAGK